MKKIFPFVYTLLSFHMCNCSAEIGYFLSLSPKIHHSAAQDCSLWILICQIKRRIWESSASAVSILFDNTVLTSRKQMQHDSKIYWHRVDKVYLLGKQLIPGTQ